MDDREKLRICRKCKFHEDDGTVVQPDRCKTTRWLTYWPNAGHCCEGAFEHNGQGGCVHFMPKQHKTIHGALVGAQAGSPPLSAGVGALIGGYCGADQDQLLSQRHEPTYFMDDNGRLCASINESGQPPDIDHRKRPPLSKGAYTLMLPPPAAAGETITVASGNKAVSLYSDGTRWRSGPNPAERAASPKSSRIEGKQVLVSTPRQQGKTAQLEKAAEWLWDEGLRSKARHTAQSSRIEERKRQMNRSIFSGVFGIFKPFVRLGRWATKTVWRVVWLIVVNVLITLVVMWLTMEKPLDVLPEWLPLGGGIDFKEDDDAWMEEYRDDDGEVWIPLTDGREISLTDPVGDIRDTREFEWGTVSAEGLALEVESTSDTFDAEGVIDNATSNVVRLEFTDER